MTRLLLLSVLFAAVCAFGQGQNTPCPPNLALCGQPMKVANLRSYTALKGVMAVVSDGNSSSDCTVGGGSTMVTCQSNGTTWAQIAGGTGGGGNTTSTGLVNGNLPVANGATSLIDSGIAATSIALNKAEYDNGTCTVSATISAANGNRQKILLTNAQTCALTFTQPATGTITLTLKITQSSTGSFNGAISGGKWPGGTVPTITATSGAIDFIACYLDGTNSYCIPSQDFR